MDKNQLLGGSALPKLAAQELNLRDLFAMAALTSTGNPWAANPEELAKQCYVIADAFLAERKSKSENPR